MELFFFSMELLFLNFGEIELFFSNFDGREQFFLFFNALGGNVVDAWRL